MDLKQSIPAKKLIDLMIHLEMCFQNHQEDGEETDSLLFMPTLFNDENETAAKGKRQLEWKVVQPGHLENLGRSLECSLTHIHEKGWTKSVGFEVGRNRICFAESGIEVCVEYAGDNDRSSIY